MILYSALEVMVLGIKRSPVAIVGQYLQKEQSKALLQGMRKLLKAFAISGNLIDRILSHIQDTQMVSNIDRIIDTLNELKINATIEDVKQVVKERGSTIHTGTSSGEFHEAYGLVRS